MQTLFKTATKFILLSGLALLVLNCNKESDSVGIIEQVTSSEVVTILETDGISSAADTIITDIFQNGQTSKSAQKEDCYVTEFSDTGYSVTFDNCSVNGSNNITGTLLVTYKEGQETTAFTTNYVNLAIDGYLINGSRDFTMNSNTMGESAAFTIVSDMKITLDDDSVIEEMGTKTFAINFDTENFLNSGLTIEGNWTVKAEGNVYVIAIKSALEASFACDYIGKGVMEIEKNGLKADVDFGDGTCDDKATLTYPNGTSEEISLKDLKD
jgi:hypothetical protein